MHCHVSCASEFSKSSEFGNSFILKAFWHIWNKKSPLGLIVLDGDYLGVSTPWPSDKESDEDIWNNQLFIGTFGFKCLFHTTGLRQHWLEILLTANSYD